MAEKVFYRVSKNNEQNFHDHYILKGKKLKQFSVHRSSNSNSDFYGLHSYQHSNDVEINIDSLETMIDSVFSTDPSLRSRQEESVFYKMIESTNPLGAIYPRIYRPLIQDYESRIPNIYSYGKNKNVQKDKITDFTPYNKNELISSINQLQLLIEHLETIFLTIHPEGRNLRSYGNNIRNLLILACTEVEAQIKGVMEANKYKPKGKYLNMTDYIKVKKPLRLDEYSIKLNNYPWLNSIFPYANWQKSLVWYENYNAVKHNRVKDFNKGTLYDAITAVSAVALLLNAQYGDEVLKRHSTIFNYFEITQKPIWKIPDYYIPPLKDKNWKPKHYLF